MASFNRALIALDLTGADHALMRAAAFFSRPLEIGQLYFFHVMPDFTKPKHLDVEFYKLFNPEYPVDEKVRDKIRLDAGEIFDELPNAPEQSVNVVEGKPFEKLIHWMEVKMIDLLVVGHKKQSQGSGITAKRVARNTNTHILYIPENFRENLKHILVPVDFSERSASALRAALDLGYAAGAAEVTALHIIPQPSAVFYDPTWEYDTFRKALRESAMMSYRKFIGMHGFENEKIFPVFVDDDFNNIAKHVQEFVRINHSDLIVTGAKGHAAINNLLFGSVTESLLERCKETPVLVIR